MKTNLALLFFLGIITISCGSKQTISTTVNNDGTTQKNVSKSTIFGERDILKLKEEWEYETLVENGEAPILNKYKETSRNRLLAKKGAVLEAQRKLAEKIGTIRLNATTTMQDFATSDLVQSRINVFLKDVTILSEEVDEESQLYKVTVQMPKLKVVNVLEEYFGL